MSYHFSKHSLVAAAVFAVLTIASPVSLLAQTAAPAPAAPPAATTPAPEATPAPAATKTKKSKKSKAAAAAAADTAPTAAAEPAKSAAPAAAGAAVFPASVSSKYASQKAGEARMHTCLDQYHANKAANGNGGLKWIQKGGGYYSECSKKLKG